MVEGLMMSLWHGSEAAWDLQNWSCERKDLLEDRCVRGRPGRMSAQCSVCELRGQFRWHEDECWTGETDLFVDINDCIVSGHFE